MKLHPITLILFLLLSIALLRLNTLDEYQLRRESIVTGIGWPFQFRFSHDGTTFEPSPPYTRLSAVALNILIWIATVLLPPLFIERLLYRKLQVRLVTALVLLVTAAVLLGLNTLPRSYFGLDPFTNDYYEFHYGWPHFFIRGNDDIFEWNLPAALGDFLIVLATMCAIALATERILRKKESSL